MNRLSPSQLYCGTDRMPAQPVSLRAGPFHLLLDPESGFLRRIRLGDAETVRAIYAVVRDANWESYFPRIGNLSTESKEDSFRVTFDAEVQSGDIQFRWKAVLTGEADGRIRYQIDGEALSAFQTNRIGICVLHPLTECAGKPATIEKADGTQESGAFPRYVSPHQIFQEMRAITYEAAPGMQAEVRFEGDVFEMEDQRNWSDASFKTYGPPIREPITRTIEKGAKVQHAVTVSLLGAQKKVLPVLQGRAPQVSISTTPVLSKPAIGLRRAGHGQPLAQKEIDRLKRLRLSHLRVDLPLREGNFAERLSRAADEARQLETSLQAAVILSDDGEAELDRLATEANTLQTRVSHWLIFHENQTVTGDAWVRLAWQKLGALGSHALIAAGTQKHFAEFNRNRPPEGTTALPCYSMTPQVHVFDPLNLVENLGGQASSVESTQQFCPQPVVISPITLRSRFHYFPDAGETRNALPSEVDPRQMSLLGAGWTLGSLARLSTCGNVHSLTYYETTGWGGVMEQENGSPMPGLFPSIPGGVFPMYHVFADIADFNRLYPTHSSHPVEVESLTLVDAKNRRRILLANLVGEEREVKIKTGTCQARVRYLDETNAEEAMSDPETYRQREGEPKESAAGKLGLNLKPYALARVDIVS